MKINAIMVSILIAIFITPCELYAFKGKTHLKFNDFISSNVVVPETGFRLNDHLINFLGFQSGIDEPLDYYYDFSSRSIREKSILDYLGEGGREEDSMPRFLWHFHDGLLNIGLSGIYDSSILWAQRAIGDQKFGDYSWQSTMNYYYSALVQKDQYERNRLFGKAFRGLGQLLHLVQDLAIPEHTRNNPHPPPLLTIENYMARQSKNQNILYGLIGNPSFFDFKTLQTTRSAFRDQGAPIPIANLFDTDTYLGTNPEVTTGDTVGLAEYSNANFLSRDTNPVDSTPIYPYPRLAATPQVPFDIADTFSPGQTIKRMYYVKNGEGETGGPGYKLSAVGLLWLDNPDPDRDDFVVLSLLDDYVYEDYARLLLPRAVGYAATLANYFFRGQIEISLPKRGFYSMVAPNQGGFSDLRLNAKNITMNDEEMPAGKIELVVKYKQALDDPFQGAAVPVSSDFFYTVVPEKNGVTSIPRDNPAELAFDLSGVSIPLWATDLTFQIVYSGKLGLETADGFVGEEMGIAVGLKDASEPTVIDYINSMDLVCLNDQIFAAGSDAAVNALDSLGRAISSYVDVYPHRLDGNYLKLSSPSAISYASQNNYDVTISELLPGHYARFYVITEPIGTDGVFSHQTKFINLDSRDGFYHVTEQRARYYQGMVNQVYYRDGIWVRNYSGMSDIRGLKAWTGTLWRNQRYPSDTTCDEATATTPLVGPAPIAFPQN